ncbi:unnamed protein product [Prorocentrum cordatum]|uniref:Uncharacterized protein n=1 Tax=Prorocentrum cordatum TaxID=2364126 RepID=A0ABN9YFL7_9DINO|nr:unnamed protein product [Polarella glacialis]
MPCYLSACERLAVRVLSSTFALSEGVASSSTASLPSASTRWGGSGGVDAMEDAENRDVEYEDQDVDGDGAKGESTAHEGVEGEPDGLEDEGVTGDFSRDMLTYSDAGRRRRLRLARVPHGRAAAALRARPVQQAGGCCASGGHAEREPTEAELIRAFFEERGRDTVRGPTGRGSATIAAWGPRRCSSAPLSGQLPTDEAQAHIQNAC